MTESLVGSTTTQHSDFRSGFRFAFSFTALLALYPWFLRSASRLRISAVFICISPRPSGFTTTRLGFGLHQQLASFLFLFHLGTAFLLNAVSHLGTPIENKTLALAGIRNFTGTNRESGFESRIGAKARRPTRTGKKMLRRFNN